MGYLGRRIGLSQDSGDSNPSGANGAVGGGILDLFAHGYFERQDDIYNAPAGTEDGIVATGGVVSDYVSPPGAIYRAHIFTTAGTFDVTSLGDFGGDIEYMVVAGGGGGGGDSNNGSGGGGGGAGGFRTNLAGHPYAPYGHTFTVAASGTYPVTIGAGGGGTYANPGTANQGGNSVLTHPVTSPMTVTATGGGGGGNEDGSGTTGGGGGSGGGGSRGGDGGPATPANQGNPGGQSPRAGGGGGAGAASADSPDSTTTGGIGVQCFIAGPPTFVGVGETSQWFAGGGGGGGDSTEGKAGGVGGGGFGNGGNPAVPGSDSKNGQDSTGGGGGGEGYDPTDDRGGHGGSGIIIVRYQIGQSNTDTAKATGGSISFTPGGKTIHVFTSSGTFTAPTPLNPTPLSVQYLVVGGGGGGGGYAKAADGVGAGGAGGLRTNHPDCPAPLRGGSYAVTPGSEYTATVGAGGAGGFLHSPADVNGMRGQSGTESEFYPTPQSYPSTNRIRSTGGGGGGSYEKNTSSRRDGRDGGSGGGGAGGGDGAGGSGNTPTDPNWPLAQGNDGGSRGPNYGAGGGGGFIAAGVDADSSNNPGPGGAGVNLSISGITTGYAGGGGGGAAGPFRGTFSGGTASHGGGAGAPADGSNVPTYFGGSGRMGSGGGGGGAGGSNTPEPVYPNLTNGLRLGGNGGSGVIIIAYDT